MATTEDKHDRELTDVIDMTIFDQILEMDETEDKEFSGPLVSNFFEQAESSLAQMDLAFKNEDLKELSSMGHFLKGSSATIGLVKIRDSCEKIQRYGKKENLDGTPGATDDASWLKLIGGELLSVRRCVNEANRALKEFYKSEGAHLPMPGE